MTAEQRRSPRHPLIMYLDVLDRKSDQALGYLSDVSDTGLMFITLSPIEPGMQYHIYIPIPPTLQEANTPENHNAPIEIEIEAVWAKPSLNPALHCVGCRFCHINEQDRVRLQSISARLGFTQDVDVNRVAQAVA